MTPQGLRTLSSRMFKATVCCFVLGIVLLIAVPKSPPGATIDPVVQAVGQLAFGLLGFSLLANLVSLVTGAIAWLKGQPSPWILLSALVILLPVGFWIASAL